MIIAAASFVLAGCNADDVTELMNAGKKNVTSSQEMTRGAALYKTNCAVCHGDQGQGADNWQKRGEDGKFLPPPLNGTGHTWHHPTKILKYTINSGTGKIGGNMPPFSGKLTDAEIDEILVFIQAKWPKPVYEAWQRTNQRSLESKNK